MCGNLLQRAGETLKVKSLHLNKSIWRQSCFKAVWFICWQQAHTDLLFFKSFQHWFLPHSTLADFNSACQKLPMVTKSGEWEGGFFRKGRLCQNWQSHPMIPLAQTHTHTPSHTHASTPTPTYVIMQISGLNNKQQWFSIVWTWNLILLQLDRVHWALTAHWQDVTQPPLPRCRICFPPRSGRTVKQSGRINYSWKCRPEVGLTITLWIFNQAGSLEKTPPLKLEKLVEKSCHTIGGLLCHSLLHGKYKLCLNIFSNGKLVQKLIETFTVCKTES